MDSLIPRKPVFSSDFEFHNLHSFSPATILNLISRSVPRNGVFKILICYTAPCELGMFPGLGEWGGRKLLKGCGL